MALLAVGCSSGGSSGAHGEPAEAGEGIQNQSDSASEAQVADGDSGGLLDAQSDAGDEAVDDAATYDAPTVIYDGPTCSGGNPAGDGGTWCTLYVQGDQDGSPHGEAVKMACGPQGSPCVACLGGVPFAGVCE